MRDAKSASSPNDLFSRRNISDTVLVLLFSLMLSLFAGRKTSADESGVKVFTPFLASEVTLDGASNVDKSKFTLIDVARYADGQIALLAGNEGHVFLLVGANDTGFGSGLPLPIQVYSPRLLVGEDSATWVGGYSNPKEGPVGRQASAFLAKVDRAGKLTWHHEYGGETERRIQSMASLSTGDLIVSATDSGKTWLARISGDGNVVWERRVGVGKGSAVAVADDVILVAAIEANQDGLGYREDVSAWSFSQTGSNLRHWLVREGINRIPWQSAEDVQIRQSGQSVYIISKWGVREPFKPLEIVKFDLNTGPLWRRELTETSVGQGARAHICTLAITALKSGDLLLACRTGGGEMSLLQLSVANGDLTRSSFELGPVVTNCDPPWSPVMLMLQQSQRYVWLFGAPRVSDKKPCGWIGQANIPNQRQ